MATSYFPKWLGNILSGAAIGILGYTSAPGQEASAQQPVVEQVVAPIQRPSNLSDLPLCPRIDLSTAEAVPINYFTVKYDSLEDKIFSDGTFVQSNRVPSEINFENLARGGENMTVLYDRGGSPVCNAGSFSRGFLLRPQVLPAPMERLDTLTRSIAAPAIPQAAYFGIAVPGEDSESYRTEGMFPLSSNIKIPECNSTFDLEGIETGYSYDISFDPQISYVRFDGATNLRGSGASGVVGPYAAVFLDENQNPVCLTYALLDTVARYDSERGVFLSTIGTPAVENVQRVVINKVVSTPQGVSLAPISRSRNIEQLLESGPRLSVSAASFGPRVGCLVGAPSVCVTLPSDRGRLRGVR